jgi:hypothetical protein
MPSGPAHTAGPAPARRERDVTARKATRPWRPPPRQRVDRPKHRSEWPLSGRWSHKGEPPETGCDPLPIPRHDPWPGAEPLAMQLRMCEFNRQSSRGALRLVVCLKQRRMFMPQPPGTTPPRQKNEHRDGSGREALMRCLHRTPRSSKNSTALAGCRSKRPSVWGPPPGRAAGDACDRRSAAGRVAPTGTKATEAQAWLERR